ncbi:MAG: DUF2877 domain-containing protein [Dermatophilaceae bacterium]
MTAQVRAPVPRRHGGQRAAGLGRTGEGPLLEVVPGAVSALSAHLLAGPVQPARVLGSGAHGWYLDVAGTVLPVLTADAAALPTAVRLARPVAPVVFSPGHLDHLGHDHLGHDHLGRRGDSGCGYSEPVVVGGGEVRLGRFAVRAARVWQPARVRRRHPGRPAATSVRPRVPAVAAHLVRPVAGAVAASDPVRAVAGLVGRGRGLTPSGDDALAGAVLVAQAFGGSPVLADAIRRRLGATTAVSAALLDAACDGYAVAPVVRLVDAAVAGDHAQVDALLPVVLSVGHTSGADLVAGVAGAISVLAPERDTT